MTTKDNPSKKLTERPCTGHRDPHRDGDSGPRSEILKQDLWQPGVIHVELRIPVPPEMLREEGRIELERNAPEMDFAAFKELLKEYEPWEVFLTFFDDPPEKRKRLDRDRFLTFKFQSHFDSVQIAREISSLALVIHAAPEPRIGSPSPPPSEPLENNGGAPLGRVLEQDPQNQWYLFRCRVDAAWREFGKSGKNVIIADLDWGFLTIHQDLKDNIRRQHNFVCDNDVVNQGTRVQHGTGVLGIAGASRNGIGMVGFAYGATLWAFQAGIQRSGEPCSVNNWRPWVQAIDEVCNPIENKRKVLIIEAQTCNDRNIEMSVPIAQAIRNAIAQQIVVCVPAGNAEDDACRDDNGNSIPPTGSILVGATAYDDDPNKIRRAESNWGRRVVVSAPGDNIKDVTCCSCGTDRYRNIFGGTSGATPKVAGTIALMLEANPKLTHEQIRDILSKKLTPIPVSDDKTIGTFLNARTAVCEALKLAGEQC